MPNKLRVAFTKQRLSAKYRGVEWMLTFEQWIGIWETSGHLVERGRGKNKYCMARFGDKGPYSPNNVSICRNEKNVSDARKNNPKSIEQTRFPTIGTGRGWTYLPHRTKKNPYAVTVSRKYVGCFPDQLMAQDAYLIAVNEMKEFGELRTDFHAYKLTRLRELANGGESE